VKPPPGHSKMPVASKSDGIRHHPYKKPSQKKVPTEVCPTLLKGKPCIDQAKPHINEFYHQRCEYGSKCYRIENPEHINNSCHCELINCPYDMLCTRMDNPIHTTWFRHPIYDYLSLWGAIMRNDREKIVVFLKNNGVTKYLEDLTKDPLAHFVNSQTVMPESYDPIQIKNSFLYKLLAYIACEYLNIIHIYNMINNIAPGQDVTSNDVYPIYRLLTLMNEMAKDITVNVDEYEEPQLYACLKELYLPNKHNKPFVEHQLLQLNALTILSGIKAKHPHPDKLPSAE
jgi:hypothetical protein